MSGKSLGIAIILINGQQQSSEPGATIDFGGVDRETVQGAAVGDTYFAETPRPAEIEAVFVFKAGFNPQAINSLTNATITFDCDTGQSYVMSNAWNDGKVKATAKDGGKVPVKFIGPTCQAAT